MTFTYHWLHIPTGKTGLSTGQFENRLEFLKFLNRCNSQSAGTWQYWY